MVDWGAMTHNEWRYIMNLGPIEGGDKPIRRLDTSVVDEQEVSKWPKKLKKYMIKDQL